MVRYLKMMLLVVAIATVGCSESADSIAPGPAPTRDMTGRWGGDGLVLDVSATESRLWDYCGTRGHINAPLLLSGDTFDLPGVMVLLGGPGGTAPGRYVGSVVGDEMSLSFIGYDTDAWPQPFDFPLLVHGQDGVFPPGPCPF